MSGTITPWRQTHNVRIYNSYCTGTMRLSQCLELLYSIGLLGAWPHNIGCLLVCSCQGDGGSLNIPMLEPTARTIANADEVWRVGSREGWGESVLLGKGKANGLRAIALVIL